MPELPEVETTLRGLEPHVIKQKVVKIITRESRLRWPIPHNISKQLEKQVIRSITRRGKYLLLETPRGTLILHLGMSGSLRVLQNAMPPTKHDHVDILLQNDVCIRFNDPRRFGAILWTEDDPQQHTLLKHLGP